MGIKLGSNAKLYRLSSGTRASWGTQDATGAYVGAAPANLVEDADVADLEIPIKKGQADATTRKNGGWKALVGALKEAPITLPTIYDPEDAGCAALMKGFLTDTPIAYALLSGDKATAGSEGLWADFAVLEMNKGEKLGEVQTINFVIAPTYSAVAPQWVRVGAASS